MNVSLPIADFFLSANVLQGFILSALLLFSSKKVRSNRWIGALIFCVSIMIFNVELDLTNIWKDHLWMLNFITPFHMAFGPLLYFYSRSLINQDKTITPKSYFHFLPVLIDFKRQIIFLLYFTGILAIPGIQKFYFLPEMQRILLTPNLYWVLPGFISFSIYCALIYKKLDNVTQNKNLLGYSLANIRWLKKLLKLVSVLLVLWLITIIVDFSRPGTPVYSWTRYLIGLPAIIFVYWLGMATYFRQHKIDRYDVENYNLKTVKVYFPDDEAKYYHQQLNQLMEKEKLYLNPLLKVDSIAIKLGVPEKMISNLLNQHVGKNFNDFINNYRVEEAKKKLLDPACNNFTIAAIAFDCGFNSLATFQRAFKQFTGITPRQYQNSTKYPQMAVNTPQIRI